MVRAVTVQEAVQLAVRHHQAGRLADAEAIYRQVLAQQPDQPDVLHLLGVLTHQLGRHDEAIETVRRAIAVNPSNATYHANLALIYRELRRPADAAEACRRAIALQPGAAAAHNTLGDALWDLQRHEEALAAYRRSIELRPDFAPAHNNIGSVLVELGRPDEALEAYAKALELAPEYAEAHNNLGAALAMLGRHAEAADAFRQSLARRPDARTLNNLGNALTQVNAIDEAAAAYRRAIALEPQFPEPHDGLGHALWRAALIDRALESFRAAMRLRPQGAAFHSSLLFALQFSPRETEESIAVEHRRFDEFHARPLAEFIRPHANSRDPDRRLRVGCVSAGFRNHVMALYTIPLFAAHDRRAVEIVCYAHGDWPDHVTARIRGLADGWRDVSRLDDEQAAELIRADGIDVLVDHTMHMAHARPLIFARKPAPVQVAWLAYPGTTGMSAMDYRLTDPHLDPPGTESGKYSEDSVRLPDTFWCYDPMCDEPGGELPATVNGVVTFGCLNNFSKVNDGVLALWARVLTAVPSSRLLMLAPEGERRRATLETLAARGVDPSRVEFVGHQRRPDYLRTYRRIDVALDTLPYNGHTTSLDAMWMGVPVVTLLGHTIVGRAGWSQLNNLGLTELAAHDEDGFVRLAAELANDLPRLAELRRTLRPRMAASPLTDAKRFARNMEDAYRAMWRRWCASPEETR